MKTIVVYYSGKGSNRFLAGKAAEALGCDAVALEPRVRGLVLPATLTKMSFGNKAIKADFSKYDSVVLCGPIYMGNFAAPCNDFIKKYGCDIQKLNLITCCGGTDAMKDDRFGYARVFKKLRDPLGDKCGQCEAFPVELVLSEAERADEQAMMNTRLSDSNFTGMIKDRLDGFVERVN